MAAGTGGKLYGVVLISGTGTIAMGFNSKGERQRASGWGFVASLFYSLTLLNIKLIHVHFDRPMLGDIGSGYWLASESLSAFAKAVVGF